MSPRFSGPKSAKKAVYTKVLSVVKYNPSFVDGALKSSSTAKNHSLSKIKEVYTSLLIYIEQS